MAAALLLLAGFSGYLGVEATTYRSGAELWIFPLATLILFPLAVAVWPWSKP